jgi:hypothetical protein
VLHVLYLTFNEGYTSSAGPQLNRPDLSSDAIRLARMLCHLLPDDAEVAGLLALMLLTDARRAARTGASGQLIPPDEQDRTLWNPSVIEEGVALVSDALRRSSPGPYQLQAAIAAVHDEAPSVEDTDWPQILALYRLLERRSDNPMVLLNQAIAAAMVHSPLPSLSSRGGANGEHAGAGLPHAPGRPACRQPQLTGRPNWDRPYPSPSRSRARANACPIRIMVRLVSWTSWSHVTRITVMPAAARSVSRRRSCRWLRHERW